MLVSHLSSCCHDVVHNDHFLDLNFAPSIRNAFDGTLFVNNQVIIKTFNIQRVHQLLRLIFAVQNRVRQSYDFPRVHLIGESDLISESETFANIFKVIKFGFMKCFSNDQTKIVALYYDNSSKTFAKSAVISNIGDAQTCF